MLWVMSITIYICRGRFSLHFLNLFFLCRARLSHLTLATLLFHYQSYGRRSMKDLLTSNTSKRTSLLSDPLTDGIEEPPEYPLIISSELQCEYGWESVLNYRCFKFLLKEEQTHKTNIHFLSKATLILPCKFVFQQLYSIMSHTKFLLRYQFTDAHPLNAHWILNIEIHLNTQLKVATPKFSI